MKILSQYVLLYGLRVDSESLCTRKFYKRISQRESYINIYMENLDMLKIQSSTSEVLMTAQSSFPIKVGSHLIVPFFCSP